MGALFGFFFAYGLAKRIERLSATTDLWSVGSLLSARGLELTIHSKKLSHADLKRILGI
jgi:hypothetical protein